jgi:hypothetical protein
MLEEERARAIECKFCGFLCFWNTRVLDRKGKPCFCDALQGGPAFDWKHRCVFYGREKRERLTEEKAWQKFVKSVRPATLQALLNDKTDERVSVNEQVNIVFKIKNKKEKEK